MIFRILLKKLKILKTVNNFNILYKFFCIYWFIIQVFLDSNFNSLFYYNLLIFKGKNLLDIIASY